MRLVLCNLFVAKLQMCKETCSNNIGSAESYWLQYNNPIFLFFLPLYLIFKHTFLDLNIRPEFSYRSERDSGGAVLRSLAHVNSLKRGVRMTKSRSIANLSGM